MGIATHHISSLDNLEPISPTNFGSVSKTWNMFFTGCGADYIRKLLAAVPNGKDAIDSELVLIIFTRVHPDYQHYIADLDSGLSVWKKVKEFCVTSTLRDQVTSWANFTHLHHNLDQPIAIYISQCDDLMKSLEGFGHRPTETHHMFTLLANLDPAFHDVRKRIFNMSPTPTLKTVKDTLLVECVGNGNPTYNPDPLIKKEEAFAARGSYTPSYYPRSRAGGSSSRVAYSGDSDKKFRWCSAVHNDQCRRCGQPGHIADRCVYDMPQAIKDWVISGAPKQTNYAPAERIPDLDATAENARLASAAMAMHVSVDPQHAPAEAHSAHSTVMPQASPVNAAKAAAYARSARAFNIISKHQSGESPADPFELEAAFRILEETSISGPFSSSSDDDLGGSDSDSDFEEPTFGRPLHYNG